MNLLKLLKIRMNEKTKVFLFFVFALFLQAGVSIGESVSNSLFLVNIGFEKLPYIYILIPVIITFIYLPLYSSFLKHHSEDTFFQVVLFFLTLMNIAIVLVIKYFKPSIDSAVFKYLFYFIMIYTIVWGTALYTLFWNFIDAFFDILDSKRIFAIFSAGTAIGAIVGGALVSELTQYIPASDILFGWSFFSLLSLVSIAIINKKYEKIPLEEEEEEDVSSMITQLSFMFKTILDSRYVFLLTSAFFIAIILATTLEFEYMGILSKSQTEDSLAALFGKLFVIVNVFNLFVNFFFFNRLVLNYGVRNVTLIQPIGYILAFAYLSVSREIEAAVFGFFIVQGLAVAIDYNNQNLLFNGVKSNIKYKVRTFIENLGEPLAVAFAGIILIYMSKDTSPFFVSYMLMGLAFFYLVFILFLRAEYPKSMVKNFESDWLDFSFNSKKIISNISPDELREVVPYKSNKYSKALALDILSESSPLETLKELLPYLNTTSTTTFKENRFLLNRLLNSPDINTLRVVDSWIDKNLSTLHLRMIRELGLQGFIDSRKFSSMLKSSDPKRKSTAIILLLNSNNPNDISQSNQMINKLLDSEDTESICEGIYALGESRRSEYVFYLAKFLDSKEEKIRFQALESIYRLSDTKANQLIPNILSTFKEASQKEREVSLNILKRVKDSQCLIPLLKESDILTPLERRSVISLVEELGLQTIPSIVTVLVEDKFSYPARSIAARTLGKLSFVQLKTLEKELILKEIELAYKHLYTHNHLETILDEESLDSLKLLSLFYRDIHQSSVEFILELLTIVGRLADFEMIKTAINSKNSKNRGNAIETIEQSTDKKIFSLLLPLIDARSIQDIIEFYHSKFVVEDISTQSIINSALHSSNTFEQHIAVEVVYYTDSTYKNIFRDILLETSSNELKDAIFLLLNKKTEETKVYRLALLAQNTFFNKFNLFELSMMLKNSTLVQMKKGEKFFEDTCEYIYVTMQDKDIEVKNIIGLEYLFNHNINISKVYAKEMLYLRISNESIFQSIHCYPTIGVLLAQEISSYEIL